MIEILRFVGMVFMNSPPPPNTEEPVYITARVFSFVVALSLAIAIRSNTSDFHAVAFSRLSMWCFMAAIVATALYLIIMRTDPDSRGLVVGGLTFVLYVCISLYIGLILSALLVFMPESVAKLIKDMFSK